MHHCNNQRMLPMQLCGRLGNEIIIINLQFYELSNSAWASGQQSFPISCWYAKNVCSGFLVSRHTCDISLFSWKTGRGWKQLWSCFSFWGWTVCYFASTPRTKGYMKMPTWWPTPFWKAHRFVDLRDKKGKLHIPPSVQGSIVCIFYCVLSNDVRMAVKKRWYQWKVRRDHARDQQRQGGRLALLRS